MARKKTTETKRPIESYEHKDKKRLNNPPVGLVTPDTDPDAGQEKKRYAYDPHLDPQLVWAGKAEHTSFEVPTVSLHVHERIDPRTIIEAVSKSPSPGASRHPLPGGEGGGDGPQLPLFEEERKEPLRSAIEFYRHAHGWTNRLIAGDSLLVMNSLLEKESMAGKVQMIYIDPPYGIRYGSNFQPFVGKRDVKDGKDEDLTAEPEQIKAFRDTWELGIHSYLTYLRDRMLLARELLVDSGSCFVQISDENVHHVRELMDEVFGAGNAMVTIVLKKKGATAPTHPVNDFILWYGRDKDQVRNTVRRLYLERRDPEDDSKFNTLIAKSGRMNRIKDLSKAEIAERIESGWKWARVNYPIVSQGYHEKRSKPYEYLGKLKSCGSNRSWSFDDEGLDRLVKADRLFDAGGESLAGVVFWEDWPYIALSNVWNDLKGEENPDYVVQTSWRAIQRCLLMTTDPGDLVFDPTCGSGTTAYVAEQWGRRWITCDTSRVALTLARQRLMTAVFDYYELAHPQEGVGSGFKYKTVPHVTLKSIANNPEIDGIHARWTEKLNEFLVSSFEFLDRDRIKAHLERAEFGLLEQYINDAAQTDPQLATKNSKLKTLLSERRAAIDEAIARHAPQETLYDQPLIDHKKARVSGPFTVEAVPAPVVKTVEEILEQKPQPADASIARSGETLRQAEWRDELLRAGIRGKAGQRIRFSRLEPLPGCRFLHADGETRPSAEGADSVREEAPAYNPMRVVVSFGPEHAPLEQRQVERAWEEAQQLEPKPKLLVFAAFQFDPEAAKDIDEMKPELAGMQFLKVQMNADLLTEDLKKKRASNESFWLIGQPDVEVSSYEFLVLSDRERKIAEYGTFKKLSGARSLAEVNGLSWADLSVFIAIARRRDLWATLTTDAGGRVDSGKHRRRTGAARDEGVPPVSWNSPWLIGGIGDIVGDLKEFGVSDIQRCRRIVDQLRGNQQIAGGLKELAQNLNFPIAASTQNWQLKTKNLHCVAVHGFDYYNTKTGNIESGGSDKIAVWLLDTDYDGRSLYPRQVFFPMAGEKEGWARLAKSLKAEIADERIEAYCGTVSLPFEPGEHRRIAVKIVDDRGIESLKVMEIG